MCTLVNNSKSVEFVWDNTYNTLNAINGYAITTLPSMSDFTFSTAMPSSGALNLIDGVYNSMNVTPFNCGNQLGQVSTVGINLTSMEGRRQYFKT